MLLRYLKNMGLRGLDNWLRVEVLKSGKVRPPQLRQAIELRKSSTDALVFREIFLFGEYDAELGDPSTILDLGANVGLSSVFFADKYPGAKILAVEPDPQNYEWLLKNTSAHNNIECLQGAAWNKETMLKMEDRGEGEWAFSVLEDDRGTVKGYTMDHLMERLSSDRVDLVKIDIEGSEKSLFTENTGWLEKVNYIVIELHDRMVPGCASVFFRALSPYKYKMSLYKGSIIIKLA